MMAHLLLHVASVLLATVFLYSGFDKLLHWRDGVDEVKRLGLMFPAPFAAATIAAQLAGGLAVATGFFVSLGAALLALFTILATLLGHKFWLRHGEKAKQELTTALEHLAIAGGLLGIAVQHGLFR
jgi:uncharacterized membrane protein YphA (DoxX/SURF4 family)